MIKSFTLPQALVDQLEAEAQRRDVPQSSLVADGLRVLFGNPTPGPSPRIEVAAKSHPAVARGFEDRNAAKPFAPQPKPGKGKKS